MGRIFKTPSDDTVEETLRMMHTANMVDVAYERTVGWLKVITFSTLSAFVMTGIAFYTGWNLWEHTGNWLKETLQSWSDSIFD